MTDAAPEIDEVAQAETELADAEKDLLDLEAHYSETGTVTPTQFDKAESKVSMARRAIGRMKRVKTMREESEHDQQVQALHDEWLAWLAASDLEDVRAAYTGYVEAHRILTRRIAAYNQTAADFRRRSKMLGISDGDRHPFPESPDGFVDVGDGTGPGMNSYPWPQIAQHEAENNRPMDLRSSHGPQAPAVYGHQLHTDARRAELAEQAEQDRESIRARAAQRDADMRAEFAEKDRQQRDYWAARDAEAKAHGLDR